MLALVTRNSRIYYLAASELKKRGVSFYSLSPGDRIPSNITVVLTSVEERHRINFSRVVATRAEKVGIAVEKAVEFLRGRDGKYREVTISIDPGKNSGIAVFGDSSIVFVSNLRVPEQVSDAIKKILEIYSGERVTIKLGDGGGIYRDRIIKSLRENFSFPIYLVNEKSTTPSLGSGEYSREVRNIVAAINIGLKQGVLFESEVELKPKEGEIKNIQKGSRELSGSITISKEMAEKVARGELCLEKAVEIYRNRKIKSV